MLKQQVNFGAALAAVMFIAACNPASSTPRADASETQKKAAKAPATGANDAIVTAADKGRIAGDSSAKTWVIIASDFQCPFCKRWHAESYRQLVDQYVRTGKVKVAYINFPLGQHLNAVPAAQGAMCASAQNKFWEYHDALFDTQGRWAKMPDMRPMLDSIARAVGVNFAEWNTCVGSDRTLSLIFADRDRAARAGVRSTPTFLIGKHVVQGTGPFSELKPIIDSAIAVSGSAPAR
jgi:protein-disulfide isomerase